MRSSCLDLTLDQTHLQLFASMFSSLALVFKEQLNVQHSAREDLERSLVVLRILSLKKQHAFSPLVSIDHYREVTAYFVRISTFAILHFQVREFRFILDFNQENSLFK